MHVDSVLFEVCETVWMIPEHRQNPPEISCLGVLLSFQPSPALISHLALPLATSAGTVRSFCQLLALKWGGMGKVVFPTSSRKWSSGMPELHPNPLTSSLCGPSTVPVSQR